MCEEINNRGCESLFIGEGGGDKCQGNKRWAVNEFEREKKIKKTLSNSHN